jgi:hypothetical protein
MITIDRVLNSSKTFFEKMVLILFNFILFYRKGKKRKSKKRMKMKKLKKIKMNLLIVLLMKIIVQQSNKKLHLPQLLKPHQHHFRKFVNLQVVNPPVCGDDQSKI